MLRCTQHDRIGSNPIIYYLSAACRYQFLLFYCKLQIAIYNIFAVIMCTLYYYVIFIRFYLFIVIKTYYTSSLLALLNANDIIDIAESALVATVVVAILHLDGTRAHIHTAALDRHVSVTRISEACDTIEIVYKMILIR